MHPGSEREDADPRVGRLAGVLAQYPADDSPSPDNVAEAAVALVLRLLPDPSILLIRRTERDGDPWSGHIAFPGGRRDDGDTDLLDTAIRETAEETGLGLARADLVGRLDDIFTPARLPRLRVAAFVIMTDGDGAVTPDPAEVVSAAWIPIRALRLDTAVSHVDILHGGMKHRFPSLVHDDFVIWGMTHRVLLQFLDRAAESGM